MSKILPFPSSRRTPSVRLETGQLLEIDDVRRGIALVFSELDTIRSQLVSLIGADAGQAGSSEAEGSALRGQVEHATRRIDETTNGA